MEKKTQLQVLHEYQKPIGVHADVLLIVQSGSYQSGVLIEGVGSGSQKTKDDEHAGAHVQKQEKKSEKKSLSLSYETLGTYKCMLLGLYEVLGGVMVLTDRMRLDAQGESYIQYAHTVQTLDSNAARNLWVPKVQLPPISVLQDSAASGGNVDQGYGPSVQGVDWRLVHQLLPFVRDHDLCAQMLHLKGQHYHSAKPHQINGLMGQANGQITLSENNTYLGTLMDRLVIVSQINIHARFGYSDQSVVQNMVQMCCKNIPKIGGLDDLQVHFGFGPDPNVLGYKEYFKSHRVSMSGWQGAKPSVIIGAHRSTQSNPSHWIDAHFDYQKSQFASLGFQMKSDQSMPMAQKFRAVFEGKALERAIGESPEQEQVRLPVRRL